MARDLQQILHSIRTANAGRIERNGQTYIAIAEQDWLDLAALRDESGILDVVEPREPRMHQAVDRSWIDPALGRL